MRIDVAWQQRVPRFVDLVVEAETDDDQRVLRSRRRISGHERDGGRARIYAPSDGGPVLDERTARLILNPDVILIIELPSDDRVTIEEWTGGHSEADRGWPAVERRWIGATKTAGPAAARVRQP